MAETVNTLTNFLGPEFQNRLMWQLLVEPEFAEKNISKISVEYFDDPNLKRLFIIILEYLNEYGKVPNLQNQSIKQAINQFKTPNKIVEEESLYSTIRKIEDWNAMVLNKELAHDGEAVRHAVTDFIKQQESRKLGEYIISCTKNGKIKKKSFIGEIEDKFQDILNIGDEEDYGTDVTEGIENALRKEFRQTIPTGIHVIDTVTGGGLGKGEIGLILTPSGVGKTTILTKISNTAYELEYNVLQIIFEDTTDQIKRKHYSIWSKTPQSKIDDNLEHVTNSVKEKVSNLKGKGRLIIKRFSQEDTTIKDIRAWIDMYQKKYGFKFDIMILDYLDCVDSHKRTQDRHEGELVVIKSFEAMASDYNIPCWSAIQSNRTGFDAEFVEAHQSGGNIKRIQKAHFFMSVAKTPDQKVANLANIRIIKARFASDGQTFENCIFNNDSMEIRIEDSRYPVRTTQKKVDSNDLDKLEETTMKLRLKSDDVVESPPINNEVEKKTTKETQNLMHTKLSEHIETNFSSNTVTNNDAVNEGVNEGANEVESEFEKISDDKSLDEIEDDLLDPEELEKKIDSLSP